MTDHKIRIATADILERSNGAVQAVAVGVVYAGLKAMERHDVEDLSDDSVPAPLREFVQDALRGSAAYIDMVTEGLIR